MIKHIVFTKFENADEQASVASGMLLALKDTIPQIRTIETGRDFKHSERSFDLALTCTFADLDAIAVYDKHPAHEEAREYIYAHRIDGKTVVYEIA